MLLRIVADLGHVVADSSLDPRALEAFRKEILHHSVLFVASDQPIEQTTFWKLLHRESNDRLQATLQRLIKHKRLRLDTNHHLLPEISLPELWLEDGEEMSRISSPGYPNEVSILDFLNGKDLCFEGGVEHIHFNDIALSEIISFRDELASIGSFRLPNGAFRSDVWERIFKPYITHLSTVTVCDRYSLTKPGQEGLKFLIRQMRSSPRASLHIYSAQIEDKKLSRIQQRSRTWDAICVISECCERHGVKAGISIGEDHLFSERSHARSIRFSDLVWRLDGGINLFSEFRLRVDHELSMTVLDEQRIRLERDLLSQKIIGLELPLKSHEIESRKEAYFEDSICFRT